jgi:hypothetical protein
MTPRRPADLIVDNSLHFGHSARVGRLITTLAVLGILAAAVSACGSDSARTVSENGITFTLPKELQFRTNGFTSTGEFIDGFYANIPLHSACTDRCGLSTFNPLPPNAIVIGIGALSGFGVGARNPDDPAPNTSVAGRTAVYKADKPGDCGGDETIKFWIPDPAHGGIGDLLIRACIKGPDLASGEQVIQTLLRSATGA